MKPNCFLGRRFRFFSELKLTHSDMLSMGLINHDGDGKLNPRLNQVENIKDLTFFAIVKTLEYMQQLYRN